MEWGLAAVFSLTNSTTLQTLSISDISQHGNVWQCDKKVLCNSFILCHIRRQFAAKNSTNFYVRLDTFSKYLNVSVDDWWNYLFETPDTPCFRGVRLGRMCTVKQHRNGAAFFERYIEASFSPPSLLVQHCKSPLKFTLEKKHFQKCKEERQKEKKAILCKNSNLQFQEPSFFYFTCSSWLLKVSFSRR